MGKDSAISWTHHTFNPYWGCMKVSPACDNCYAEAWDKRVGGSHWGPKAEYRTFGDKHWNEPLKWNRQAEAAGERHRVFCASMADVFDNRAPEGARDRLWALTRETPHLDWLLLTKRPHNIAKMLPSDWGNGYPNVWLGVTAENQTEAERRIPVLLTTPARIRFISAEPLLGPVDLLNVFPDITATLNALTGEACHLLGMKQCTGRLNWVIVGGESGHGARPMHPAWVRSLRDQCVAAGVAFHFKQWGEWAPGENAGGPMRRTESIADWFDGQWVYGRMTPSESAELHCDDEPDLFRVGNKAAGRLLDGREWNEVPR